jgi:hypothetical protein
MFCILHLSEFIRNSLRAIFPLFHKICNPESEKKSSQKKEIISDPQHWCYCSVSDPHRFYADPDPAFLLNADPDPDPTCRI